MLFDDFPQFIDYPHNNKLKKFRNTYGLNQTTFDEKAGISLSIRSKWEGGLRHPSKKMYQQLVTKYSEMNISKYSLYPIKQVLCIFYRPVGVIIRLYVK